MRAGQLAIDEQAECFRQALSRNRTLTEVLTRAAGMCLPGWYLVAGCLYQTVWNVVTGQPSEAGILDYDLAYYDASDLSWEAEDAVIRAGDQVFAGLPAPVQIRNQARVHLWYEPSSSGGRPGDRGWVHFLVTMRRCQRSSVPGLTIRCRRKPFGSIRDNAASTARSVHSSRGFGFTRRSTATSWRRTSISAFFDADDRASSASQDSTATANR